MMPMHRASFRRIPSAGWWYLNAEVARLTWPEGYQIYDVQVMPGIRRPRFPYRANADGEDINEMLRYMG